MPTPTLIMTLGLSGSGKSTWAREQVSKARPGSMSRANKDEIRALVHAGVWAGATTEKQVEAIRDAIVIDALTRRQTVIVDDTNIHPKHEKRLREIAQRFGAVFIIKDFTDVPVEVCIERDAQRTGTAHLGADIIKRQERDLAKRQKGVLQPALLPQPYFAAAGLPTCVLVDVDGTLAKMIGREHGGRFPYDWHRVGEDEPNEAVVDLVQTLLLSGENVIIMSGRDGICREETQAWLDKHVAPGLPLFMRAAGDQRKDSLVKFELFNEHIAGRYRVRFVLDDRAQVVRMWRDILGLDCYQVADGDF